jgi:hypothetical protein
MVFNMGVFRPHSVSIVTMKKGIMILVGLMFPMATLFAAAVGYRGDGSCVEPVGRPPVKFDDATGENIRWKVPVANWGYNTPVVAAGRVFIISEPGWKHDWPLLQCFDAHTGKELWAKEINHLEIVFSNPADRQKAAQEIKEFHAFYREFYQSVYHWNVGTPESKALARKLLEPHGLKLGDDFRNWREYAISGIKKDSAYGRSNSDVLQKLGKRWSDLGKSTGFVGETWRHGLGLGGGLMCVGHAFATPVTDGERIWVATAYGAFACYDLTGKLVWMKWYPGKAGEFCRNGRSPALYKNLLLSDMTAKLRAMDKDSGELKWSHDVDDETIMTPVVITVNKTDVLLCFNKKAFRLPDGQPLKVEVASDFGHTTLVKTDEPEVTFSFGVGEHCGWTAKGKGDTPSPAGVRWKLTGDELTGQVLWSGIDGQPAGPHGIVYHAGKLYFGGLIVEPLTGKVLAGVTGKKGQGATPPTRHLLWAAAGNIYGLEKDGHFSVTDLNGKAVATSRLLPA